MQPFCDIAEIDSYQVKLLDTPLIIKISNSLLDRKIINCAILKVKFNRLEKTLDNTYTFNRLID